MTATSTRTVGYFVLLATLIALAGCSSSTEPPAKPSGPNDHFSGTVGGSQTTNEEFQIPDDVERLTVSARYSIGGTARFDLFDPSGKLQKTQTYNGGAAGNDATWFRMDDPPAGEWVLRLQLEGGVVYSFEVYWVEGTVPEPPEGAAQSHTAAPALQGGAWVAIAGGVTLSTLALGLIATELGRFKTLSGLAALGLFSRLEKDEVLAHEKREQVYQFIKDNPGPSFSDILRELDLSNGTLVHHLRILEAQEFIKPHRDGFRTRFYLRGPKVTPTAYLTRTQQQILEAIAAKPGVTQKELTHLLRLPREAVSYHTKRLAAQGQLQVRQEGKWRRYWRVQTGSATTSSAAAQPA